MPLPTTAGIARTIWYHHRYVEHLLLKKLRFRARYAWMENNVDSDDSVPPPLVYKLVLTYKCNLRCVMCYEWGDVGWCHEEAAQEIARELDWEVVQKIFAQGSRQTPSFILIGGEPLLYSRFVDFARLLQRHKAFAITCTNGMFVKKMRESSLDNPYLTYLISLDGLQEENDRIRGRGVYGTVVRGIRELKSLRPSPYMGVQFTVRPENVGSMYDFCREMVDIGVDWILFNLSWFVTKKEAEAYEAFMQDRFGVSPRSHLGYMMPFEIDKDEFVRQFRRIRSQRWPVQISSYLKRPEDIYNYVAEEPAVASATAGADANAFQHCWKQWIRMDVTPDAEVRPCALYPDISVGSLRNADVMDVWNSEAYARFRRIRRQEMLPVCKKCDALYLYDARRRAL